jgi:hypothetical protein
MKPRFIDINGHRYLWRDILELRRKQLASYAASRQTALFEMVDDTRPASQRTASDRYHQPLLFDL